MIHSLKYDYYEFPGGGIEENETPVNAVIRKTMEEAGLSVIRESVRECFTKNRCMRHNSIGKNRTCGFY